MSSLQGQMLGPPRSTNNARRAISGILILKSRSTSSRWGGLLEVLGLVPPDFKANVRQVGSGVRLRHAGLRT